MTCSCAGLDCGIFLKVFCSVNGSTVLLTSLIEISFITMVNGSHVCTVAKFLSWMSYVDC